MDFFQPIRTPWMKIQARGAGRFSRNTRASAGWYRLANDSKSVQVAAVLSGRVSADPPLCRSGTCTAREAEFVQAGWWSRMDKHEEEGVVWVFRATAVVHKHEHEGGGCPPPRWNVSVVLRLGSPVFLLSFLLHPRMNDIERLEPWAAFGSSIVGSRRFPRQNPNRKSIRGRKLAPFAETGFLVSARCGEGRRGGGEVQAVPCANQAETKGEKERGREEDRHEGKGASKIEADGVGRGRKM